MKYPHALTVFAFAATLFVAAIVDAQPTIVLQSRTELSGTVKSVLPGVVKLTDDSGKDWELKIQGQEDRGLSMSGQQGLLRFPATIQVRGSLDPGSLARGTLVRFSGLLNRLGRTDGAVATVTVFDEDAYPLGIEVLEQPTEAGGFGSCRITTNVYSTRNGRLIVDVPTNDYVRSERLAFELADDVAIAIESDDYRRARSGDKVVRAVVANFSTGDSAIQEIELELAGGGQPANATDASLAAEYLKLSDEPSRPRDLRSAHFLLHTDVSDRDAKILSDKLENMISLVAQYYGRPPVGLIECYVVRELRQWPQGAFPPEAIAKIAEPAGITLSMSLGQVTRSVVYSCDRHGVVQHEAIHAYCAQSFGSTGPTWYAEGMAEMGQYWKKDQMAVEADPAVIDYLKNSPPKRLLDIVAAGQITGDSWKAYAWRWALCHMLATNPNYSGRLKALGIGMMAEQPGASFESVYGPVAREVSFEYDLFVQQLDNGYRPDLCAWQWNRKFQYIIGTRYAKTTVHARYGWQATGVKVKRGESYDCAAQGSWKLNAVDETDANGDASGKGRLLGVVMTDLQLSEPFELGTLASFTAPADGNLYVRCRDDWNRIEDNDGELTVYFRNRPQSQPQPRQEN